MHAVSRLRVAYDASCTCLSPSQSTAHPEPPCRNLAPNCTSAGCLDDTRICLVIRIVTIDSHQTTTAPWGTVPSTTSLPSQAAQSQSPQYPSATPLSSNTIAERTQGSNAASTSLVPATRSYYELEEDDAELVTSDSSELPSLSYLHPSSRAQPPLPPHRDIDSDAFRARKRPRVDSLSSVTSVERSLLIPETPYPSALMRLSADADSTLSVSPDDLPEAGPSTPALSNGHNGVVKGNGFVAPFTNGNGKAAALADGHRAEKLPHR